MTASAQPARLLGIPLGDFGLFSCVFLAVAAGFLSFFASCALAILSLLAWNSVAHGHISYTDAYRWIALPTGLGVMAVGLVFLTGTWLWRKLAGED